MEEALLKDKWLKYIRRYLLSYRDGLYELPYIANNPQLMLESMKNMPMVTFFPEQNFYKSNTPFLDGICHYEEIEEGLWLLLTDVKIKKSVCFRLLYDKHIPKNYYFLTLHVNNGNAVIKSPKLNIEIEHKDRTWTLFKPGTNSLNAHFKGENSIFLSIMISKEWMKKNNANSGIFENEFLKNFNDSDEECLFLPNFLGERKDLYEPIIKSVLDKDESGIKNFPLLKKQMHTLLSNFIAELNDKNTIKVTNTTLNKYRLKLFKAENILKKAIFDGFPTIKSISKDVRMGETKLKEEFKKMFGATLYQYYSHQQMKYAKTLLESGKISVKEVASNLGYANTSKFSSRFQKTYNQLPSEILK